MDAAKDLSIGFHAVAHHPAVAVRANRRERVDCTLEAIEDVMLAGNDHFKRLVVFVFANFACSHTQTVRAPSPLRRCSLLFCEQEVCDAPGCLQEGSALSPSCPATPIRRPALCELCLGLQGKLTASLQLQLLRSRDSTGK
jgi:hypothetical protein